MASDVRVLSDQLRALAARCSHDVTEPEGRRETERLMLVILQSLVERLGALESRTPTTTQLAFLMTRMEDQRWRLETWRRLTKWGARLVAVLGAYGLMQSISWKPIEVFKHFLGLR